MKRTIEVLIHPDGSLAIDAVDFSGTDCLEATAFLEQALGEAVLTQQKPEYNRRTRVQTNQRQGHGRSHE